MKRLLLLAIITSWFYNQGFAQCRDSVTLNQPNPTTLLNENYFFNKTEWLMTDEYAGILKTFDQGKSWKSVCSKKAVRFSFVDSVKGYGVSSDGYLLKTYDQGSTWSAIRIDTNVAKGQCRGLKFVNDSIGYVAGSFGVIKTGNGGKSWSICVKDIYYNVDFNQTGSIGIAVGDQGIIVRTSDGGKTWEAPVKVSIQRVMGVHFVSDSVIYISGITYGVRGGSTTYVYRSLDKGLTWKSYPKIISIATNGSSFSRDTVLAFRADSLYKSIDGGISWTADKIPYTLSYLFYVEKDLYAVSGALSYDYIIKSNDFGKTWAELTKTGRSFLTGVYFVNESIGYAVGWQGTILKTVDGGKNWKEQSSGTQNGLTCVHFVDSLTGYVSGWNQMVLKTIDGGEHWSIVTSGPDGSPAYHGIYFKNKDIGFAMGDTDYLSSASVISRTEDGGRTWTPQVTTNNPARIVSMKFYDDSLGYAAGAWNIMKTTDGGKSWRTIPVNASFTSIHIFDKYRIIAGASDGSFYKTFDGGNTWNQINKTPVDYMYLTSICFTDSTRGYFSLAQGEVYKTEDGGITWDRLRKVTRSYLNHICLASESKAFVVGEMNTIVQIDLCEDISTSSVTSFAKKSIESKFMIYPNPNKGRFIIEGLAQANAVKIYNSMGLEIKSFDKANSFQEIDLGVASSGIYYVKVDDMSGSITQKIIVEE
ncbi:MAG: YCF48-related protein [Cytophagaceae bacterium]